METNKVYKTFKDLEAWKHARELAGFIYRTTQLFPAYEMYGLTNQVRHSAISVASNIAEGYGRQYKKEGIQYLYQANGSLNEVETRLLLSNDLNFISSGMLSEAIIHVECTGKLSIGYIHYLQKNDQLK